MLYFIAHDLDPDFYHGRDHCSPSHGRSQETERLASVLAIMVWSVSLDGISAPIIFHAVSITLILSVGNPLLILQFTKATPSNKGIYNVSQLAVTVAIIAVGACASYRFSDHISVHAIFGMMVICLLLPRPVLQHDLVHYYR